FPGASAAIPPPEPKNNSAASLDSAPAAGTIADAAPAPLVLSGSDIHLVPVLKPGLDMGPVLGRLNIPTLALPAEGGPYLTITAMHATSHVARTRPKDLPLVAR